VTKISFHDKCIHVLHVSFMCGQLWYLMKCSSKW